VVTKNGNYGLGVDTYNKPAGKGGFVFSTNLGNVGSTTSALTQAVWNHVAATYDGSYVRLYVNGVLDTQTAATGNVTTSTYPLFFGCTATTSCYTGGFAGAMDEVGIWPRALSVDEIAVLAKEPLQGDGKGDLCDL